MVTQNLYRLFASAGYSFYGRMFFSRRQKRKRQPSYLQKTDVVCFLYLLKTSYLTYFFLYQDVLFCVLFN